MSFCFCCPCCVRYRRGKREVQVSRCSSSLPPWHQSPGRLSWCNTNSCLTWSCHKGALCLYIPLCCISMSSLDKVKLCFVFFFFSNMASFRPVCLKKKFELSLTHSSSCPSNAACPLVLAYFSPMLHCHYFLFLQEIFLRIFKPTELLSLHVILCYCKKRAKRRAVVRTVTTQPISHFLWLAVMLQVQEQKQSWGEILHRFLLSLCRSRAPSRPPSPRELGMLENKYIPFRKQDKEWFDNIDLVHKRCSSAWKGQCITMQFQYSGCFSCWFFLLFFPLAVKTEEVLQMKVSSWNSFWGATVCCQHQWRMQGTCVQLWSWIYLWVRAGISSQLVFVPGSSVLFPFPDTHI